MAAGVVTTAVPPAAARRAVPGWVAAFLANAGTVALGMALIGPDTKAIEALAVGALFAGAGALATALVAAPVTALPVGRVEIRLRVALVGGLTAAFLVQLVSLLGARPGGTEPMVVAMSWLWMTALLALVAVDTWQTESHEAAHPGRSATDSALPPLCAIAKRAVDLVVVAVVLPLAIPVIAVAAAAVAAESRGGWLFTQTRLGAGGRPFRLFKLRTMDPAGDDAAHRTCMTVLITGEPARAELYGKVAADPRRTTVGKVLRRLSIDELPQLWNVLKGDMSIVGPRPPLPWEAELYSERMRGRLAGKPGLTGLWQVAGRNKLPFAEMIELDLRYWERWSVLQELAILARTPKAVLWARNTE